MAATRIHREERKRVGERGSEREGWLLWLLFDYVFGSPTSSTLDKRAGQKQTSNRIRNKFINWRFELERQCLSKVFAHQSAFVPKSA